MRLPTLNTQRRHSRDKYVHRLIKADLQRPTVLAKIYGFFKIGYRNAVTGRAMRMNVLVMENLFYERRFSKIYDLKGSTRNRLIQATGKVNEVLLDENLMESKFEWMRQADSSRP